MFQWCHLLLYLFGAVVLANSGSQVDKAQPKWGSWIWTDQTTKNHQLKNLSLSYLTYLKQEVYHIVYLIGPSFNVYVKFDIRFNIDDRLERRVMERMESGNSPSGKIYVFFLPSCWGKKTWVFLCLLFSKLLGMVKQVDDMIVQMVKKHQFDVIMRAE